MSRIHDALRKIELERGTGNSQSVSDSARNTAEFFGNLLTPVTQENASKSKDESLSPSPLTFETTYSRMAEDRSQSVWKPDRRHLLFWDNEPHFAPGMEEFRTLRSRLDRIRSMTKVKRILISSALPGEGKSFVAANLSFALSRTYNTRVLLVDADLRRPQLHRYLGALEGPGLSEYLHGMAEVQAVIQQSPIQNFCFVPSGRSNSHAAETVANPRWRPFLDKVTECFDWIIIDSPPLMAVNDAAVLACACDGVVLVVRAGTTPYHIVQRVAKEFKEVSVLGVVLNGVSGEEPYTTYYEEPRGGK
jgi:protein-tyrosine kinase